MVLMVICIHWGLNKANPTSDKRHVLVWVCRSAYLKITFLLILWQLDNAFGHNGETNKQTRLETGQINYWPRSSQLLPMVRSLSKNCPLTHGFSYGKRGGEKLLSLRTVNWLVIDVWWSCNLMGGLMTWWPLSDTGEGADTLDQIHLYMKDWWATL